MNASEMPDDETRTATEDGEARQYAGQTPDDARHVPLFLRDGNEGRKGNEQDEKDEAGE